MKVVRWILGRIILLLNFVFSPKKMSRASEQQQQVDKETEVMSLYQFAACPFCVKVRRSMRRLNVDIELRDAKSEPYSAELVEQGGSPKVPCLRIEKEDGKVEWLYESGDIVEFLETRFA